MSTTSRPWPPPTGAWPDQPSCATRSALPPDGEPAGAMVVFLAPGGNAVQVAEDVSALMERKTPDLPEGLGFSVIYNTAEFVLTSIEEVYHTFFEALVLVLLVGLGCATTPVDRRDWLQLETPHFEVSSALSPADTRRLAGDLERFRGTLAWALGRSLPAPADRIRLQWCFDQ